MRIRVFVLIALLLFSSFIGAQDFVSVEIAGTRVLDVNNQTPVIELPTGRIFEIRLPPGLQLVSEVLNGNTVHFSPLHTEQAYTDRIYLVAAPAVETTNVIFPTNQGLLTYYLVSSFEEDLLWGNHDVQHGGRLLELRLQDSFDNTVIRTRPKLLTVLQFPSGSRIEFDGDDEFVYSYLPGSTTGYDRDLLVLKPISNSSNGVFRIEYRGYSRGYRIVGSAANKSDRAQMVRITL
jgi:hypothetical protein